MEKNQSHSGYYPSVGYPWIQFLLDRSIVCLVLLSMLVQLILVVGGANRHRIASRLPKFIVWTCYMAADFVATSALGAMIHYNTREPVYAIWACVVMVHLGGPDTITAYSLPDSNLWRRHCFYMLYKGSVAVYVVYVSAVQAGAEIEWFVVGAASLIFIVGFTKYAERTRALWLASPSQIARSVEPVYNYMKIEHALGFHIDENISDDEIADIDIFRDRHEGEVDEDSVDYQYIVAGEKWFEEDDKNGEWAERIVTIKDVWEHEGQVVTDNYILCVAHALFKMYKRRFAGLQFHEGSLRKTRRFFGGGWRFSQIQAFSLVEIELKFMCDYLFSKSSGTAFSGWGVVMRVVNICLLGVCWYLIMRGGVQEAQHVQRTVTYILMSVAVGVEVFQLGRILLSDWSMVWVVCESIRQSRKLSNTWRSSLTANLIHCVAKVVGRVRKWKVGGGNCKYCQNRIPQLCVMETCWSARGSYPPAVIRKVVGWIGISEELVMRWYIPAVTASHITRELLEDDFIDRLLNFFKDRKNKFNARKQLSTMRSIKGMGWEHVILAMHVGTAVLEKLEDESKIEDEEVKRNIRLAVQVSRYFAYLVVTCPEMMPVDAENAKGVYRELFTEMKDMMMGAEHATLHDFCTNFKHSEGRRSILLREAQEMVTEHLEISVEERWRELRTFWLETLLLCGVYDKCGEHGERVTEGGEFLTLVWVLMGHLGIAEESYIPTALKTDPDLLPN